MEDTLCQFFTCINTNNVEGALSLCHDDDISCTYPDPGRNWKGKDKGRIVMTAIFGQLSRSNITVTYEIINIDEINKMITTKECWGHPRIQTTTTYQFTTPAESKDDDYKILSMSS